MYLSRLILNPRNRRVRAELAQLYELHRTIMHAFPSALPADERVLFRLDTPRDGVLSLLVQSQGAPNWTFLQDGDARGHLLETSQPNPWVKTVTLRLSPGQVLAFRLRANPTVKRTGRRLGLLTEEAQCEWLARKGLAGGFQPLEVRVDNQGLVRGRAVQDGTPRTLSFTAIQYEGMLRVHDPAKLQKCVNDGVGSAKGLGFGLLSLAPIR